jgi:hypothetical protein
MYLFFFYIKHTIWMGRLHSAGVVIHDLDRRIVSRIKKSRILCFSWMHKWMYINQQDVWSSGLVQGPLRPTHESRQRLNRRPGQCILKSYLGLKLTSQYLPLYFGKKLAFFEKSITSTFNWTMKSAKFFFRNMSSS